MNTHTEDARRTLLRSLPSVDEMLNSPALAEVLAKTSRNLVVDTIREEIAQVRRQILNNAVTSFDVDALCATVVNRCTKKDVRSLRKTINATGVVIHTNLGRSALAPAAVEAVLDVAGGYSTLEYNTDTHARGSRHNHYESLICKVTGAEAAMAVNNNAAAVMLVLSEFGAGHEAIVSRGQLVEIGGSFRVPDIMETSGAKMVDVGTTNKTRISDYEKALTDNTSLLVKVHPSNYRMLGFTEETPLSDMAELAAEVNKERKENGATTPLFVYEDQGSGAFLDLPSVSGYSEPTVSDSLKGGADLVSFSGDKLLGGPQAGIIVGAKPLIDRLKKHPLARVLRLDKMTLAALEATLELYVDPAIARKEVPTLRMLSESAKDVKERADILYTYICKGIPEGKATIDIIEETSRSGGGALPMCDIPTFAVRVVFTDDVLEACNNYLISERKVPVIGRIHKNALLFDARTILNEDEMTEIRNALSEFFAE